MLDKVSAHKNRGKYTRLTSYTSYLACACSKVWQLVTQYIGTNNVTCLQTNVDVCYTCWLRRLHFVSTSPFLLSRPAHFHCVNVSAFNTWMCSFSISNSGHWGVWKIFSLKFRKILTVDCPELRDSATYKLNKFKPPRNYQLESILKKLSHLWVVSQCLFLRSILVGKGICRSHRELACLQKHPWLLHPSSNSTPQR